MSNGPEDDLAFEWPKDDNAEVYINVDDASPVTDETLRSRDERVEAETQADLLDDLVGVLCIDEVFDAAAAWFVEVGRVNLDNVRERDLQVQLEELFVIHAAGTYE